MADASIFAEYLKPVRSIADYADEADKRKLNALQLLTAQQGQSDDQAMRAAYQQSGGDPNKLMQILQSGGQYKAAQALQKTQLDAKKTQADIGHLDSQSANQNALAGKTAQETRFAAAAQHAQQIAMVNSPQDVVSYIDSGIKSGVFPAEQRDAMLQKAQQYPTTEAWKQAQTQASIPVLDKFKVEAENSRNALTNQTSASNNAATQATSRANNSANNAVTMRGQNMVDARANANQKNENGKPPAGYAWGPVGADGNPTLIAVKGGPADLKMAGALNADTQALSGSMNSFDRLGTAANEILNHPGLNSVYGLRGVVPNMPGTQAADAAALLNTLKSQVGFSVLQDMRNNSKTGGALGAVSDKENLMLQANLAALEKAQSFEQAKKSLAKIIDYTEGAKGRLRDAYNIKHGAGSVNPSGATQAPMVDNAMKPSKPSLDAIFK